MNGGAEGGSWCESLMRKLVRSRLKWAGHVERMEGVRLTKRAGALGVEGDSVKGIWREWEGSGNLERGLGGVETGGGDGSETALVMKKI